MKILWTLRGPVLNTVFFYSSKLTYLQLEVNWGFVLSMAVKSVTLQLFVKKGESTIVHRSLLLGLSSVN